MWIEIGVGLVILSLIALAVYQSRRIGRSTGEIEKARKTAEQAKALAKRNRAKNLEQLKARRDARRARRRDRG